MNWNLEPATAQDGFIGAQVAALQIVKEDALRDELLTLSTGLVKQTHVVVKSAPFYIVLQLQPGQLESVTFHNTRVEVALVYEEFANTDAEKAVSILNRSPCRYQAKSISADGLELTLQLRIDALSSQCENSLFRVRITMFNASNNEQLQPSLTALTGCYCVISKSKYSSTSCFAHCRAKTSNSHRIQRNSSNDCRERPLHRLLQIEENLGQANRALKEVHVRAAASVEEDFESSFREMLNALSQLPRERTAAILSRIIESLSSEDASDLVWFIDCMLCETQCFAAEESNIDSPPITPY